MKREKFTGAALAALLFFGGAAVGVLANRYYTTTTVSAKTSETYRHRYVAEMESKLKLTTAQVKQLEGIMDDTKAKYKAVQVKQEHIELVKSILTAQQIPGYEKLLSERERRAREQDEQERRDEQRRLAEHKAQAAK
jgi:regulator of protease activity HflC (stomatin/prohibitin superfamily)